MTTEPTIPESDRPAPLEPLGPSGSALWAALTAEFTFRPDELRLLSSAAKMADLIDRLETGLSEADLLVTGSRPGMLVANGLIGELRQARMAQASLLKSLKIPDDAEEDDPGAAARTEGRKMTRSEAGRVAAMARWNRSA